MYLWEVVRLSKGKRTNGATNDGEVPRSSEIDRGRPKDAELYPVAPPAWGRVRGAV